MNKKLGLNTSVQYLESLIDDYFSKRNLPSPFYPGNFTANKNSNSYSENIVYFGDILPATFNLLHNHESEQLNLYTLSDRFREIAHQQLGIPLKNIGLIDRMEFLESPIKKNLPPPGSKWTMVYSGRISYSKGIEEFLYCAHALQNAWNEDLDVYIYGDFSTQSLSDLQVDYVNNIEELVKNIINLPTWKNRPQLIHDLAPNEWITHENLINPFLFSSSHYFFDDFNISAMQAINAGWGLISIDWGGLHDYSPFANLISPSSNFIFNHNDQRKQWYLKAIGEYLASQIHDRNFLESNDLPREIKPEPIARKVLLDSVAHRLSECGLEINHLIKPVEDWRSRDELYFLTCCRLILAGHQNLRRIIPVISSQYKYQWHSMNEILPALKEYWLSKSDSHNDYVLVNEFPFSLDKRLLIKLSQFLGEKPKIINIRAETTTSPMISFLKTLCSQFLQQVTYLHETGAWGAVNWHSFLKQLKFTQADTFIATCQGDIDSFKLSFPEAKLTKQVFPLSTHSAVTNTKKSDRFFYIGRISEQKNIHLLILAIYLSKNIAGRILPFHFYGSSDNLGSPLCGVQSRDYQSFLDQLVSDLGLENDIFFHGHIEREELYSSIINEAHTFVSISLHHDENFGAAAFQSLIRGRPAILSSWGGHREHIQNQSELATAVPVTSSAWGPSIDIHALVRALCNDQASHSTHPYELTELHKDENVSASSFIPLSESKFFNSLCEQLNHFKVSSDPIRQQIFHNFKDPLAHQLWSNYGMENLDVPIGSKLVPWAKVDKNQLRINDPHRGEICLEIAKGSHCIQSWDSNHEINISEKLAIELSQAGWLI